MSVPTTLDCLAPAKLNLFLHVTGRRADGYHLLQSAFILLDRADRLRLVVRDDGQVRRLSELDGVPAEADLVVRAARLLQAELQRRGRSVPGADITVEKHLPMGGGLGGGSSDAATTLMGLNLLWQGGLSQAELMALGLSLGADVPFFIFGQSAFAEGVGEALQPLEVPESTYLVIEPGVSVPTAAIFCAENLTRDTKPVRITDFSRHIEKHGVLKLFGRNDLQAVATGLFPPIAQALAWLGQYGEARMTGSGACVFCAFASVDSAQQALAKLPPPWRGWIAKSVQRGGLHSIGEIE